MAGASKVAANPTGSGNSVVPLVATPCNDSLHQSYAGTFNREMGRAWFTNWLAFSSSVILLTSAAARCSGERLVSSQAGFWLPSCPAAAKRETQPSHAVAATFQQNLLIQLPLGTGENFDQQSLGSEKWFARSPDGNANVSDSPLSSGGQAHNQGVENRFNCGKVVQPRERTPYPPT